MRVKIRLNISFILYEMVPTTIAKAVPHNRKRIKSMLEWEYIYMLYMFMTSSLELSGAVVSSVLTS